MSNSTSSKSHSKKLGSSRDRDKNRSVTSESGGSSQCDTPPLTEKDGSSSHRKYAGIGLESVLCMAEQVGVEINTDAATNLAEDVSYKLRQLINTIATHSTMMKKTRVDSWDVNTCLSLADTSPVVGASAPHYTGVGEEDLCCQVEHIVNVTEAAMTCQSYVYSTPAALSVEWVTDERSLPAGSTVSAHTQNYYTKVARAILNQNFKKKLKDIAVEDLRTNTRIGPIFPNLFNLAVLVLNNDNLKYLNVRAKKPLQSNVLDMMDALCSNPCSADTNIEQQFQRLFPVMVSNILSSGSLSEKMVAVLTKITRTWPSFSSMGKEILYDYLSKGPVTQLTAPMISCLSALGRSALVECLSDHLSYIDETIHQPRKSHSDLGLRETLLEASCCLLTAEPSTPLEDYVATDYTLYEMLGDSLLPRRLLRERESKKPEDKTDTEKPPDEDFYLPRSIRRSKLKLLPRSRIKENTMHKETIFEPVKFKPEHINNRIHVKVKTFRNLPVKKDRIAKALAQRCLMSPIQSYNGVVVASGLINRFRFRLHSKARPCPIFGMYLL